MCVSVSSLSQHTTALSLFFTIVYPRVLVCKSMHVNAGAQRPKEGIEFPDPGVIVNCELPSLSVETETRVPQKSSTHSYSLSSPTISFYNHDN